MSSIKRPSRFLQKLLSNRVLRSTLLLMLGSAAAKAVGLAIMPILTRLYTPEDFGRLSFFVSATTVLGSILTLRYVVALPIPTSALRARALLLQNTILLCSISLLTAGAVFVLLASSCSAWVASNLDEFWVDYWWLISLGAAGAALYELLTMWATREKNYSAISRSQMWQALSGATVKLAGGVAFPGALSLTVGQIVQQSSGIMGILPSFTRAIRRAWRSFRVRHIVLVSARYSEFPIYKLPSHFIYAFAAQAPILIGIYIWDVSTTGQLGLALQAIALPLALISQNASRVYYAELAAIGKSDWRAALELTKYMAVRLFAMGLCMAAALYLAAPTLFRLGFGSNWTLAGEFARALAIYIPTQFVASPLIMAYNIYGNQRQVLIVHFMRALLVCCIFILCYRLNLSAVTTIYIYSIAMAIHYALICYRVVTSIKPRQVNQC